MSGWQPIETAPQDCGEVLLYAPSEGVFVGGRFGSAWARSDEPEHDFGPAPIFPTHWQPLPDPPQS